MLEKRSKIKEESNPKHMLKKLLQDFETLEKFYTDKEYRNKLESAATYPSLEYVQLENIVEQDKKVKEKLTALFVLIMSAIRCTSPSYDLITAPLHCVDQKPWHLYTTQYLEI